MFNEFLIIVFRELFLQIFYFLLGYFHIRLELFFDLFPFLERFMDLLDILLYLYFLLVSVHLIELVSNQTVKLVVFVNILDHFVFEYQVLKFTEIIRIDFIVVIKTFETLIADLSEPILNRTLEIGNIPIDFGFDFIDLILTLNSEPFQ